MKKSTNINWTLFIRIIALVRPFKLIFISAICSVLLLALLSPQIPRLIQFTLDTIIAKSNYPQLVKYSLIILTLLLIQAIIVLINSYLAGWIGQKVVKTLREYVYSHLTNLKLKFYDKTPVGTMVTRTVSDIETISELFAEGLINIWGDVLQIIVIVCVMLYSDWRLTLIVLSVLPLLFLASHWFRIKVKQSFQDVRTAVSNLNSFVQERITGMQIIQIFNQEENQLKKFKEINKTHLDANIRSVFYYSVFFPMIEIITAISLALMIWWLSHPQSYNVETMGISFGKATAFILLINMFFRPIRQLADRFNNIQMGMVAAERIFNLVDDKEYIETSGDINTISLNGDIEFNNVWFAYNDTNYVLKDISFKLEKGKTLAITGTTGAGKSSIINLLTRFYEFEKGKITLHGVDIRAFDLTYLRSKIAVVLQDVFLFSGSIFENIRLHNPDITLEMVKSAAQEIGVHSFIMKLPNDYNYKVMERGGTLSTGQRQIISFVRALVYNPEILILDEATSSIDSETEDFIQKAIEKMLKNRTCIVIAHRLSTIKNAHKLLKIEHGRIVN